MVGIYKITSPSNKVYIGQSINIKNRWKQHKYSKSRNHNPILINSFLKYGVQSHLFEIIHELPNDVSIDVLNKYEHLYLLSYIDCGVKVLNAKGAGDSIGSHSDEIKKKISLAKKGKASWNSGKTGIFSDDVRARISSSKKGKKHTAEHIEKVRKHLFGNTYKKGKPNSIEARKKASESLKGRVSPRKGKKLSAEHAAKINKFPKGNIPWNTGLVGTYKHTEDAIKSMSEKAKIRWAKAKKDGVSIAPKGENSHKSKLTEIQVLEIKNLFSIGALTDSEISRLYKVAPATIRNIKIGRSWKHINY